jgi:serine protease AprX
MRLHADPRFTGAGVTLALIAAGFYPHPDLTQPHNRIRAWVDVRPPTPHVLRFSPNVTPRWPGWDCRCPTQPPGLHASAVAAGNGWLSHGLYRGLASEAEVVLIQARETDGEITGDSLRRALAWLTAHGPELGVRVAAVVAPVEALAAVEVDTLDENGMLVIAPFPERRLTALTVHSLDTDAAECAAEAAQDGDGPRAERECAPDLATPSLWAIVPLLPGSDCAQEAKRLFERRWQGDPNVEARLAALHLLTPYYQHVNGLSLAAPIVAGVAAGLLQANPALTPAQLRQHLLAATQPVPGVSVSRQGAGVLDAGLAITHTLAAQTKHPAAYIQTLTLDSAALGFWLYDREAQRVEVLGSWNNWQKPGLPAAQIEPGVWHAWMPRPEPGLYVYKYRLDGDRWLTDPGNPARASDNYGGWNSLLRVS